MGATAPLVAFQAGMGLYSSYEQAKGLNEQGKAEQEISNQNARMMELQADDAIARGATDSENVARQGRSIKGTQRAGYAGQNVAVGTGTAAGVQTETDTMSKQDALTVQNNAFREAWGYRTNATAERFQGSMKRIAAKNEARNTLLTGGLNAARDITAGVYLNSKYKNTGFTPSNPTEAKFDRYFRSGR